MAAPRVPFPPLPSWFSEGKSASMQILALLGNDPGELQGLDSCQPFPNPLPRVPHLTLGSCQAPSLLASCLRVG